MVLDEVRQETKARGTGGASESSEGEGGGGEGGGGEGEGGGRVLVVVNDERTCYQLRQVRSSCEWLTSSLLSLSLPLHLHLSLSPSLPPSPSTSAMVGVLFWNSSLRSICLPSTLSTCWGVWQGVGQGVEPGRERDLIPRESSQKRK